MPRTLSHGWNSAQVLTGTLLALAIPAMSFAQSPGTAAPADFVAAVAQLPAPRDSAWPGTVSLAVDATDLDHRVLRIQQSLPVAGPGRLTLLYPRFLPGTHGPYGDVSALSGLKIQAAGQALAWTRDTVDSFAFHVEVPAGVRQLDLQFQHLSPLHWGQGRPSMTRALLGVQWNQALLYPAGHFASAIRFEARLKLPEGWRQASALRGTDGQVPQPGMDGWVRYAPVSLETLVDSPMFAGPHLKRIELDPPGALQPVALNILADEASQLEVTPQQIDAHRALVQQSDKLFGVRHFRQYDFLLSLSEHFGGIGLEHHESSENGVRPNYFKDWDKAIRSRELLPHEYVHSWNGKFRRPLDLWTPQYNLPMRNSLLWMYEGMTQYWGHVLAARSGLSTPDQARHRLAEVAAYLDVRVGRTWRNLQDTTNEGTMASRRDKAWRDWQRSADYYDEATLIWLDADTLIREQSGGVRSLDDFAKAFFGITTTRHADGAIRPATYRFEDVVRTLNAVQPHDWASFLRARLDTNQPGAPLDGLARSGWRLDWAGTESDYAKHAEGWSGANGRERPADFQYSLGLRISSDGKLDQVMWGSPAFQAGLAPGLTLVAVNLDAYKPEKLAAAIQANTDGKAPIQLLLRDGDRFRNVSLDWRGGQRFPRLVRVEGTPDRLTQIQAAR
jgi:predicted metalloprotease with PDZ domain